MLLDTHNPYKPTVIDWPPLDAETRERLVALPIWDIAVQTEGKARIRVLSYAEETPDPLLRHAIELDAFEEGRHKEVLSRLVEAYGIRLAPQAEDHRPRKREWGFIGSRVRGWIDSLFALGVFAMGQTERLVPAELAHA